MDKKGLRDFKERTHLQMVERLAMLMWLLPPPSTQASTLAERSQSLAQWLDTAATQTADIVGRETQDPARTALLAGEIEDLAGDMKGRLERLTAVLRANGVN